MSRHDHFLWDNGLFLHASSVLVSGGALLFLGNSGAGKSTMCQLLSQSFPVLADDIVFVHRNAESTWHVIDGTLRMLGRQPVGQASDIDNQVPLLSVLRISQARAAHIETISPLEACRHLMDAALEVQRQQLKTDHLLKRTWFAYVADIARRYPGWQLHFSLASDTLELIREKYCVKSVAKATHGIDNKERREHYASKGQDYV